MAGREVGVVCDPGRALVTEDPGNVSSEPSLPRNGIGPFSRRHLAAIAVVLVSTAAILALVTVPTSRSGPALSSATPVSSFYLIGAQSTGLEIGSLAPELSGLDGTTLLDLGGAVPSLAELRGRPVWIVFWATWCPPCQQETPDIQRTYEEYPDDLVILAIDVQEPAEIVDDYRRTYGLTYRIALDVSASVMQTYRVFGLPTHYFIDRQGVIRERQYGPLTLDQMHQRVELISAPLT